MATTTPHQSWWALGAISVALLSVGLDVTILNVAWPTFATELNASTSELQWFANAYTMVLAAGMLPAGLAADRYGHKGLLLGSLGLFGVASAACAYAVSPEMLIVSRALLGVAAAFMIPVSMSLINVLFTPKERSRAISAWTLAMSIGIPLGPVLGGWLLDHYWHGSVFLVNVPLVVVGIVMLALLLPRTQGTGGQGFDVTGVALSSVGLVALTYGLVEAGENGWGAMATLVPVIGGVAVLAVFTAHLRRARNPLVDRCLFRSADFTWGSILVTLASFVLMGAIFVLPMYFQAVGGTDALGTGMRLLPVIAGMLISVPIADRLRIWFGAKIVIALGFALMTVGLLIGATTNVADGYSFAASWISVIGFGLGFSLPPSMDIAMGTLSDEQSGMGSGVLQVLREVGGTVGVSVLGTVLNSGYRSEVDMTGLPAQAAESVQDTAAAGVKVAGHLGSPELLASVRSAFTDGMTTTLVACAAFTAIGAVLALVYVPRQREYGGQTQAEPEVVAN